MVGHAAAICSAVPLQQQRLWPSQILRGRSLWIVQKTGLKAHLRAQLCRIAESGLSSLANYMQSSFEC